MSRQIVSRQGKRHRVMVKIVQELGSSHSIARIHDVKRRSMLITNGSCRRPKVGRYCSASSAWRFEQGGDLSDGFGAWADVSHRGARVAVPGLGHDQLQRDALLAEMGGRGVAKLVQLPPGVPGEQDPGRGRSRAGPVRWRGTGTPAAGRQAGPGRRSDRNTGPAWRPPWPGRRIR